MMFGKNKATPKVESAVAKSVSFELTIADIARRSERRAWLVASGAVMMSLILAGGYFYMLPLKEKVPYLVMADAYTGTSTVARLQGDFANNSITASEAINRSNVAHFVMARESYDVALMNLRDWTTVYTMSTPEVSSGYTALHSPNNPQSPYQLYGKTRAIRVKILSIVLIGGGKGITPKGATVRFQRSIYDKSTGASRPLDSMLATLEFTYKSNLKMSEKDRIENPLGFRHGLLRVRRSPCRATPKCRHRCRPIRWRRRRPARRRRHRPPRVARCRDRYRGKFRGRYRPIRMQHYPQEPQVIRTLRLHRRLRRSTPTLTELAVDESHQ
jgi:type IV secretion system protein VirB8